MMAIVPDDLPEFLLARIAEDEQISVDWPGELPPPPAGYVFWRPNPGNPTIYQPRSRMLAECEVKRWIVDLHAKRESTHGPYCAECSPLDLAGDPVPDWPCTTIRLIALPYCGHPDYRAAEWALDE